jgi:hypothetical protein
MMDLRGAFVQETQQRIYATVVSEGPGYSFGEPAYIQTLRNEFQEMNERKNSTAKTPNLRAKER